MAAAREWKCGVCRTKAGDLVCSRCVTLEAERRRVERSERLETLNVVREAAAKAIRGRRAAVHREARLQKEAAEEHRLKEQVRKFSQRVAQERIMVASASFSLRNQRDTLAAAESQLVREAAAAETMKRALLDGLGRHADDAARTLRQRRWRKIVQLFVLLPVAPSMPWTINSDRSTAPVAADDGDTESNVSRRGAGSAELRRHSRDDQGGNQGVDLRGAATVSGVSTLMDLPLPNNGDYSQVPADVLMAALGLLSRLVTGIASCLGISLPHPLFPTTSTRYAAIAVDSSMQERSNLYPLCPLSKLAEIGVMGAASSVCNTVGGFETALDLLRSDVVHLCVEGAKVPVDRLWPAEALLLNLWELHQYAISELRSLSPMVDVPLPIPRDPREVSFTNGGGIRAWGASPGVDNSQRTRHTSRSNSAVAVVSRGPEDEDDAYEFIVDDGVAPGEASEASGVGRWTSWGLRSAATGGSGSG
ncbi:unnamed protein product [Ascophyllum nodosum]